MLNILFHFFLWGSLCPVEVNRENIVFSLAVTTVHNKHDTSN